MTSAMRSDGLPMRVGLRISEITDENLRFAKQLGADDLFVQPSTSDGESRLTLRPDHVPSVSELRRLRNRIEDAGLRFAGIHSLQGSFYNELLIGGAESDQQVERFIDLLQNMGTAGIGILGYQWNPRSFGVVTRTSTEPLRGGAEGTAFDLNAVDTSIKPQEGEKREYTDAKFWEYYEAFLEQVLPIAEEAGVHMAVHPADPPVVPELEGIPRLLRNFDTFKRAMEVVPSDNHGLKLCLGCFSQMGEDIPKIVRYFGERDEIVFVHFRDVVGSMPTFHETFVDEGNFDEYRVMEELYDVGFTGVMIPDHVPKEVVGGHRTARGFTVGYLRGLTEAVRRSHSSQAD